MLFVAGSYQNYQNGAVSNKLTGGKCAECVSVRVSMRSNIVST
jgi:hypothetical protein